MCRHLERNQAVVQSAKELQLAVAGTEKQCAEIQVKDLNVKGLFNILRKRRTLLEESAALLKKLNEKQTSIDALARRRVYHRRENLQSIAF